MSLFATQFGVQESSFQLSLSPLSVGAYQPYLSIFIGAVGLIFLFVILAYLIRALLRSRAFSFVFIRLMQDL